MKKLLVITFVLGVSLNMASAVALLGWEVTGVSEDTAPSLSAGTVATNISSTAPSGVLSRGAGAALPGSAATNTFGASGFDTASLSLALSANDYFTFSIAPSSGFKMTLTDVTYKLSATTSGATGGALFSSVGGFAVAGDAISTFTITGGTSNDNSIALTSAFQNLTSSVEFRLYFFGGGTSTTDKVRFRSLSGDDLVINGTVTVVPEPGTFAMIVGGAGVLALIRRRRR